MARRRNARAFQIVVSVHVGKQLERLAAHEGIPVELLLREAAEALVRVAPAPLPRRAAPASSPAAAPYEVVWDGT